MSDLQQRLRRAADTLRRTSMPLADLIPLLQQAADALEEQPTQAVPLLTDAVIAAAWESHVVPVFGKNGINPIVFGRAIESLTRSGVGSVTSVRRGFMCATDFQHELGEAAGGAVVYPDLKDLKMSRPCWEQCGVVEVVVGVVS